jgi:hypothetical protein
MSVTRTPWHIYFALMVQETTPPDVEVRIEIILTKEPQRGDLLLLRSVSAPRRDDAAGAFRELWPRLRTDTIVEFKSLSHPLAPGDLARLQGYGAQYFADNVKRPLELEDLTLVLVVPRRTPMLVNELHRMRWKAEPLGGGYERLHGSGYPIYVAVIDEVAEAEQNDLLGLFSRREWTKKQVEWLWRHRAIPVEGVKVENLEESDEILREIARELPRELLKRGVPIEEVLVGLTPEQRLLIMPDDALRALSEDYIRSLSPELAAKIRARIGRPSPG